jgi:hypothetical protein
MCIHETFSKQETIWQVCVLSLLVDVVGLLVVKNEKND